MRTGRRFTRLFLLLVALLLAGCSSGVAPSTPTHTPAPRATVTAANPSGVGQFICANPPGSSAIYAYVNDQHQLALVKGCSTPIVPQAPTGRALTPIAFSPSATWLLAWNNVANPPGPDTVSCLALVAVSSGAVTPTQLCSPGGSDPNAPRWYNLIGWASDASFYLATTASDASVTVSFVSLPQMYQRVVTHIAWVASVAAPGEPVGIVKRGDDLFYAGYRSTAEGGAWLHRFSLITESDTRIVRLGLAGTGGCQVTSAPCTWTGPWDVSANGKLIAYHNPGPTQSLTDTSVEANTPLYVANSDGSGARQLFPKQPPGQGFNQPAFSPDGAYVSASFANATPGLSGAVVFEKLSDGSVTSASTDLQWQGWSGQPGVAIMYNVPASSGPGYITQLDLYSVSTGASAHLETGASDYVWA